MLRPYERGAERLSQALGEAIDARDGGLVRVFEVVWVVHRDVADDLKLVEDVVEDSDIVETAEGGVREAEAVRSGRWEVLEAPGDLVAKEADEAAVEARQSGHRRDLSGEMRLHER